MEKTPAPPLHVEVPATAKSPAFSHKLGRVNVVLGANGTGKTTLLHQMYHKFIPLADARGAKVPPVFLESDC